MVNGLLQGKDRLKSAKEKSMSSKVQECSQRGTSSHEVTLSVCNRIHGVLATRDSHMSFRDSAFFQLCLHCIGTVGRVLVV